MEKIKIKINGQEIYCDQGETIGHVAFRNGIEIPGLCFHPDLSIKANCRVCVVEIPSTSSGQAGKLVTACSTKVAEGMEIFTDTERVKRSRNLNIEMIFAEHIERCPTCVWRLNCKLLELAEKYKIEIRRFDDRKGKRKVYKFANAVEIDGTQCIDCRNCLDACNELQKINYLKLEGKGINQEIVPVNEPGMLPAFISRKKKKADCIYCGQCAVHCPVSAAQEQADWQEVEKLLKEKSPQPPFSKGGNKILIAQYAPSIRVSVGEEFGAAAGKINTGQVAAALKQLGFNYVFDVNFGADITTLVEAGELVERVKSGSGMPMFTSCCPAWVKYVEFYRPDLIPNLTTARSPQLHAAGLIKTYWARSQKIDPKNIFLVSIMPCTAKKFEAARGELKIGGRQLIDHVLTTREFAYLIKKNKIDFLKLKPAEPDNPFGQASGSAAIYGFTGGVLESALRVAKQVLPEKKFSKLRTKVVNGIGNISEVLDNLNDYDYIEVMACPDGCIGGGGQPIPTNALIRQKRKEALRQIDTQSAYKSASENKQAQAALKWLKSQGKLNDQVLYTKYKKRS